MKTVNLDANTKKDLLEKLLKRSPSSYGEFEERVYGIVNDVRTFGDEAIFKYTERFDGAKISKDNILVTEDEIKDITFQNEKRKGQLKIIKVDLDDNEVLLEGVTFDILDSKRKCSRYSCY